MSEETYDLVKQVEDAVNRRDADALGARLHPDFVYHSAIARSEGDSYRGVDGMRRYFRDVDATWDGFRIELQEIREAGDQFVVLWRVRATSHSGVPLDQTTAQIWTLRDGKLWRNVAFTDLREAFAAAGLTP